MGRGRLNDIAVRRGPDSTAVGPPQLHLEYVPKQLRLSAL